MVAGRSIDGSSQDAWFQTPTMVQREAVDGAIHTIKGGQACDIAARMACVVVALP